MRARVRLAAMAAATTVLGGVALAAAAPPAAADYGPGSVYQVEISANPHGEGVWFWAALSASSAGAMSGTGDYQEADCIHLGGGHFVGGQALDAAAHYGGELRWSISDGTLTMSGIGAIGGIDPLTISVPLPSGGYGHGDTVTFADLFGAITGTFSGPGVEVQIAP